MREWRFDRNASSTAERRSYSFEMLKPLPRSMLALGLAWAVIGCAAAPAATHPATVVPPVNTVETEIAPDFVADTLLTDVRTLDQTIVIDVRYATANNFTGAPLPGYLANRAFLRREAAASL